MPRRNSPAGLVVAADPHRPFSVHPPTLPAPRTPFPNACQPCCTACLADPRPNWQHSYVNWHLREEGGAECGLYGQAKVIAMASNAKLGSGPTPTSSVTRTIPLPEICHVQLPGMPAGASSASPFTCRLPYLLDEFGVLSLVGV